MATSDDSETEPQSNTRIMLNIRHFILPAIKRGIGSARDPHDVIIILPNQQTATLLSVMMSLYYGRIHPTPKVLITSKDNVLTINAPEVRDALYHFQGYLETADDEKIMKDFDGYNVQNELFKALTAPHQSARSLG